MQHEIARRLVNGVWTTVDVEEDGGGGGSLPSGGSTGEVLTKESNADGDVGWEPGGGTVPFVGPDPPGSPADGELWWDTDDDTPGSSLPDNWTANDPASGDLDTNGGRLVGASVIATNRCEATNVALTDASEAITIEGQNANPTSGGGFPAGIGSLYLRSNGQAWLKTGAGNTDWTQLGGSPAGAIQVVRVPIAFDTPDLVLTGITVYTPAVGDVLLDTSYLSVTTQWDGATPGLSLYSNGDSQSDRIIDHFALTSTNDPQGGSTRNAIIQKTMGAMYLNASSGNHIIFETTDALKLMVDDGAGGDPGSMAGEGEFVLIIAPAA